MEPAVSLTRTVEPVKYLQHRARNQYVDSSVAVLAPQGDTTPPLVGLPSNFGVLCGKTCTGSEWCNTFSDNHLT